MIRRRKQQSKIIAGDCIKSLAAIPDNSIHLTVTSPPYDSIREYKGNSGVNLNRLGAELLRVTVDGGMCAVVINDNHRNFQASLTTFEMAVAWKHNLGWKFWGHDHLCAARQARRVVEDPLPSRP